MEYIDERVSVQARLRRAVRNKVFTSKARRRASHATKVVGLTQMCSRHTNSHLTILTCVLVVLLTVVCAQEQIEEECPQGSSEGNSTPELLSWAVSLGAKCESLRTDNSLATRGLVATSDIPGGSVIVSLPRSLALSVSPSQSCPDPKLVLDDVWSSSLKNFQLALLLLTEVKRGSESRWHPYIQTLPRSFDSLVHWSDKEIQELQYSSTYAEQRFIQEAKQQLDDIQELYWKLQSSGLVTKFNSTLQELVWASDIVRSRAFAISKREGWLSPKNIGIGTFMGNVFLRIPFFSRWPAIRRVISICRSVTLMCIGAILFGAQAQSNMDLALLPVIDSINHNSSSLGHLQPSNHGNMVEAYIGPDGACALQEVTAAYATASNEVLLQHYGFVDTDNTNDVYTANILEFVEQNVIDQPNEEQLQDVHSKAALKTALTEAQLTSKGWSPATLQALRYLFATQAQASAAKSLQPVRWLTEAVLHLQMPTFGYFFKESQSDATEARVDEVLYSLCQSIAESKPTTLTQDSAALDSLQPNTAGTERHKLALQFRVGYKRLLHSCCLHHERRKHKENQADLLKRVNEETLRQLRHNQHENNKD